ncbi:MULTISPECIES: nucleotidyltransferase family protein [unclassified Clostridium]|uniref:nucleotidyltransferase family protein n=1 Tax=unclassified Clostridium TaxID=2614128 RepID=UPI0025B8A864|nr:nucleotidyltransferase domain-containing protein [Clostridium sp.]MCI6691866.1 nucleotidyltransferase domain-containing protein [Clostridium sp.]MDY2630754.1 nucleotidyltransferase domain-containing protein [Clostridium sp.]MDY4252063.1 nucleotidyltransferase domain-containing protein [Clostridium sp.]
MLTNVEFNLDKKIVEEIYEIASKYKSIRKILLFGSRARKDNSPKSDIDLAIYIDDYSFDLSDFIYDIENNTSTLLEFDFTNINEIDDSFFIEQVEREGIPIYEKC